MKIYNLVKGIESWCLNQFSQHPIRQPFTLGPGVKPSLESQKTDFKSRRPGLPSELNTSQNRLTEDQAQMHIQLQTIPLPQLPLRPLEITQPSRVYFILANQLRELTFPPQTLAQLDVQLPAVPVRALRQMVKGHAQMPVEHRNHHPKTHLAQTEIRIAVRQERNN
jgi:hypothetical protein